MPAGGADQPEPDVGLLAGLVDRATEGGIEVTLRRRLRAPRTGLLDDEPAVGDDGRTRERLTQLEAEGRAQAGKAGGVGAATGLTLRQLRRVPDTNTSSCPSCAVRRAG